MLPQYRQLFAEGFWSLSKKANRLLLFKDFLIILLRADRRLLLDSILSVPHFRQKRASCRNMLPQLEHSFSSSSSSCQDLQLSDVILRPNVEARMRDFLIAFVFRFPEEPRCVFRIALGDFDFRMEDFPLVLPFGL
jgi:hypothetical protein